MQDSMNDRCYTIQDRTVASGLSVAIALQASLQSKMLELHAFRYDIGQANMRGKNLVPSTTHKTKFENARAGKRQTQYEVQGLVCRKVSNFSTPEQGLVCAGLISCLSLIEFGGTLR